jgi:hypothetical protein
MKKVWLAVIAVFVLAAPVAVEAQICLGYSCDWVYNGNFSDVVPFGWGESGVTWQQISDTCLSGSPSTWVAQLDNGDWVNQDIDLDGPGESFSLQFILRINNDSNNWSDYLYALVWNLDTNQYEEFYLYTADYNTSCNGVVFELDYDYSYSNVRVEFYASEGSSVNFQIDRVSLFARSI